MAGDAVKSGPAFGEPRSLAEQLQRAVDENQCEAIINHRTTAHGPGRVFVRHVGDRCDDTKTTLHPTLNKRLCWVHRHAAENFNRSTALRFVEKVASK